MRSCWEILGIEKTTDKLLIKRAYTTLAHTVSPEDDPEGFRKIHSAYKQALKYASSPEKTEDSGSPDENRNLIITNESSDVNEPHPDSKEEDDFDFSSINTAEEFPDDVEKLLEMIVEFKTSYGVDTSDNVERWNQSTLFELSLRLFELYSSLYDKTGDLSLWQLFFDEPLMKYTIYYKDLRTLIQSRYPEDTEAGKIISEHLEEHEKSLRDFEKAAQDKVDEENNNTNRKNIWLSLSIGTFVTFLFEWLVLYDVNVDGGIILGTEFLLFEFLIFCICNWYIASNWGKEVTGGAVSSLFTRNVIVIFGCILYLFILILTMVGKDWATIGIRSIPAVLAIAGVIAMCIQHKILNK